MEGLNSTGHYPFVSLPKKRRRITTSSYPTLLVPDEEVRKSRVSEAKSEKNKYLLQWTKKKRLCTMHIDKLIKTQRKLPTLISLSISEGK